ncbi:Zinc/iron permease [Methyloversatilis universalis FAM5]|jgi:zinc and cadmium transporter|uniref:Zinc/iron permease n=1 Tax=Methyloversatilis universalis (strain ATCC BAA-1314 / DSM 25237 / JCM 13912 / CCUG 52030 / FAM5) TaxID=1000565 RepID=F5R8I6_METUF|nr:ZIP family metal transporter [Methyloversatilis universalis]EGK73289.1 Zinc/iron permease [Methyloversatilis universalis FAM5]
MSVLAWIVLASLAGGAISVCAAALFGMAVNLQRIPMLISYSVGALLGAALLGVLPQAIEEIGSVEMATSMLLAGILGFFLLEKLVLWRHCHEVSCEAHDPAELAHQAAHEEAHRAEQAALTHAHHVHAHHGHGHGHGNEGARAASLILIGDAFHNFVDGVLIAAAFAQSVPLGIVTATAIVAHEIPQEVGDYLVLLHSGMSRLRALAFNLLSSMATLVGAVGAYFALSLVGDAVPYLLCIAAASMIYVAVADLIPGLHKRAEIGATLQQVLLISLGVGSILLIHHFVDGFAHGH